MRNFFNCLNQFKAYGNSAQSEDCDFRLPPKIKCPRVNQCDEAVQNFLEGRNVCFEDISTQNGFNYCATVSDEKVSSASEFENGIEKALKDLGLNAQTVVKKEKSGFKTTNFLVIIHVS